MRAQLAWCLWLTACSGAVAATPDAGGIGASDDAGPQDDAGAKGGETAPAEAASEASTAPGYPAAHPPLPLQRYLGGAVLLHPKIVTISFAGDDETRIARFEQFGDTITKTPWWTAVTDGYCLPSGGCIGPGEGGGHVRLSRAALSAYSDDDVQALLKQLVADAAVPAPSADTLYSFYFPNGVIITLPDGSTSCDTFGAYHNATAVSAAGASETVVAYAVMPRCGGEQYTTLSASHELIEAATNAHPLDTPVGFTIADDAWSFLGGEVADVCVDLTASGNDGTTQDGFVVQRSWSNKAAAASHDPCVPAPTGVAYFNSAPDAQTIPIKVGATAKVTVTGFSDALVPAWAISATELDSFLGGNDVLSLRFDRTSLTNGQTATLSITLNAAPEGAAVFVIASKSGQRTHTWAAEVVAR